MKPNDLAVISVLGDMGNGEVRYQSEDLPLITGKDHPLSTPDRILHWDAEWHFDPKGVTFEGVRTHAAAVRLLSPPGRTAPRREAGGHRSRSARTYPAA